MIDRSIGDLGRRWWVTFASPQRRRSLCVLIMCLGVLALALGDARLRSAGLGMVGVAAIFAVRPKLQSSEKTNR